MYTIDIYKPCLYIERDRDIHLNMPKKRCLQLVKGCYVGPHQCFMFRHMDDTCVFVSLVQTRLASQAPICNARHPTIVLKLVVLHLCIWRDCSCVAVSKASDGTQQDLPWGGVAGLCVYSP